MVVAPRDTSFRAMAAPMPRPPPVTTATCPESVSFTCLLSHLLNKFSHPIHLMPLFASAGVKYSLKECKNMQKTALQRKRTAETLHPNNHDHDNFLTRLA